jgi:hypothetical protein
MYKKPFVQKGWQRVLLYIIIGFVISVIIALLVLLIFNKKSVLEKPSNNIPLEDLLLTYFTNSIGFVLAVFLARKWMDRKTIVSLGFTIKGNLPNAFAGLFTALLILSAGSLLLISFNYLYFTGYTINSNHLLLSALIFTIVAFTEEIVFRGYILNNLMESFNKWIALLISSALFALLHITNPDVSLISIIAIFIAGILLGINYIYTKNLWFGICLHFAWNFFQGPILGYEVSGIKSGGLLQQTLTGPDMYTGGNFGFEGSVICIVLELVTILLLFGVYEKRKSSTPLLYTAK